MAALTSRFDEALALASELHRTQTRKGTGIPYVAHLLAVASLVLEHGGDEDSAIAALLHDAVEDQGGAPTLAVVRARFGDEVARIVSACSDTDQTPKPPWRARKEAYVAHLSTADAKVLLVSAADKLHNARSVVVDLRAHGAAVWSRFSAGREEQLWYYDAVTRAFEARGPEGLARELREAVTEMARLADLTR